MKSAKSTKSVHAPALEPEAVMGEQEFVDRISRWSNARRGWNLWTNLKMDNSTQAKSNTASVRVLYHACLTGHLYNRQVQCTVDYSVTGNIMLRINGLVTAMGSGFTTWPAVFQRLTEFADWCEASSAALNSIMQNSAWSRTR